MPCNSIREILNFRMTLTALFQFLQKFEILVSLLILNDNGLHIHIIIINTKKQVRKIINRFPDVYNNYTRKFVFIF